MSLDKFKMEKLQPLITKMNGWANFLMLAEIATNRASEVSTTDIKTEFLENKVKELEKHLRWSLNSVIESSSLMMDMTMDEDESQEADEVREYAEELLASLSIERVGLEESDEREQNIQN